MMELKLSGLLTFVQIGVLGDDQVCSGLRFLPNWVHGDVHDSFLRSGRLQQQLLRCFWEGDAFSIDMRYVITSSQGVSHDDWRV